MSFVEDFLCWGPGLRRRAATSLLFHACREIFADLQLNFITLKNGATLLNIIAIIYKSAESYVRNRTRQERPKSALPVRHNKWMGVSQKISVLSFGKIIMEIFGILGFGFLSFGILYPCVSFVPAFFGNKCLLNFVCQLIFLKVKGTSWNII